MSIIGVPLVYKCLLCTPSWNKMDSNYFLLQGSVTSAQTPPEKQADSPANRSDSPPSVRSAVSFL